MNITNNTLNQFTQDFISHLAQHGIAAKLSTYSPLNRKENVIRIGFYVYHNGNHPDQDPLRFYIGLIDINIPAQAFIRDITLFDGAFIKLECDDLKANIIGTVMDAETLAQRCAELCNHFK